MQDIADKNICTYSGNIKSNIIRIEQKIIENDNDPFTITDMIRGTIRVENPLKM